MGGLISSVHSIFAECLAASGETADLQRRNAHPLAIYLFSKRTCFRFGLKWIAEYLSGGMRIVVIRRGV